MVLQKKSWRGAARFVLILEDKYLRCDCTTSSTNRLIYTRNAGSKRNVSPKIFRDSREKKTASLRRLRFGRSLFAACFYYMSRHQARRKVTVSCRHAGRHTLKSSNTKIDRSLLCRDIGGDWKLATRVYSVSILRVASCNRDILMALREYDVSARNRDSKYKIYHHANVRNTNEHLSPRIETLKKIWKQYSRNRFTSGSLNFEKMRIINW